MTLFRNVFTTSTFNTVVKSLGENRLNSYSRTQSYSEEFPLEEETAWYKELPIISFFLE